MYKYLWTSLIAMGLSLIVVANAYADPIAALGARTPAIAIDPVLDRGMIVYEVGGRIYGRFVDNAGRGIAGNFLVFPVDAAISTWTYKDPTIVFKMPQNRFYIAARRGYPSSIEDREGTITVFDNSDGIAVTTYDAAGTRLATRVLHTPGPLPSRENEEARPAIAVDTTANASCCVAVAWEDPRAPTKLYLMRLSPDLALFDAAPRAIATPAGNISNLSATYNGMRDRFAFAYDACSSPGRGCSTFITALPALLDGAERSLPLPERSSSTRNYGYPSIAYVPGSDSFLVSFGFATKATPTAPASRGVRAFKVVTVGDGTMMQGPELMSVTGSLVLDPFCPFCVVPVLARDRSQVIALGTQPRAMIVAPSVTSDGRERFVGYTIGIATMRMDGSQHFSSAAAYIPTGGGAYSPRTGRVIGTWRQDTREASIWAFPVIP